ncbi:MAG TPA: glycosyltransferase family 2 protein [Isosphaeraceae bacterium]|nr:glycosyltransferase family 2 protein [Isosphaeraceae bacterium]
MHKRDLTPDSRPEISVVVPLFDEERIVGELHRRLDETLSAMRISYEILFVNDGSRDATPRLIDALHVRDPYLSVIHLSRNFGHQPAVSAGLDHARGRAVMIMDGDLQDPPELIPRFVRLWREGNDVVYAIRHKRKENAVKRLGYFTFYRLLRAISEIDIPLDSGDFCLMDRRVVEALRSLPEQARFVRGLRTFVGFRQVGLPYERGARQAGQPKYTLFALIRLAVEGLVSFSSYPLRLGTTYLGVATAILSAFLMVWVLIDALINHTAPRGWASVLGTVLFMGSVQLVSLGIIGEYIRLIFLESKRRPAYIIDEYRVGSVQVEGHLAAEEGSETMDQEEILP